MNQTIVSRSPEPSLSLKELEASVARAAVQGEAGGKALPEEVFWAATQGKDRFRYGAYRVWEAVWNALRTGRHVQSPYTVHT